MSVIGFTDESIFSRFGNSQITDPFDGEVFKVDSVDGRFRNEIDVDLSVNLLNEGSFEVFVIVVESNESISGSLAFVAEDSSAIGKIFRLVGMESFQFVNFFQKFL